MCHPGSALASNPIAEWYHLVFSRYCDKPEKAELLDFHTTQSAAGHGMKVWEVLEGELFARPWSLFSSLHKLRIPTLIIHGKSDVIPESTSQHIHEAIQDSILSTINHCGHFSYVEEPDVFFEMVEQFLR